MNKLKVLYKKTGREPEIIEIEDTLEAKQKLVGGLIEVVPYGEQELVCNEEGKILGLYPNCIFDYDTINGNFFIANDDYESGNFKSLTDEEIKHLKLDLKYRQVNYTPTQMKSILKQEKELDDELEQNDVDDLEKLYEDMEKDLMKEPSAEDLDQQSKVYDENMKNMISNLATMEIVNSDKDKKDYLSNQEKKVKEIKQFIESSNKNFEGREEI